MDKTKKQATIKPWVKELIVRLLTLALEMIDKYLETDEEKAQVLNLISTAFTAQAFKVGYGPMKVREIERMDAELKKADAFLDEFKN